MDKVSLKIVIAGRTYPLTIKKEEEEAIIGAADKINKNIKKLQGNYAVKDMQDLLAMTTLQMAVQIKNGANTSSSASEEKEPLFDKDIIKIIKKIETQL